MVIFIDALFRGQMSVIRSNDIYRIEVTMYKGEQNYDCTFDYNFNENTLEHYDLGYRWKCNACKLRMDEFILNKH